MGSQQGWIGYSPTGQEQGLEKATLHYYQAMREVLGENDILEAVIKAEKAHLMKVMQYIVTDAKFTGLSETW